MLISSYKVGINLLEKIIIASDAFARRDFACRPPLHLGVFHDLTEVLDALNGHLLISLRLEVL